MRESVSAKYLVCHRGRAREAVARERMPCGELVAVAKQHLVARRERCERAEHNARREAALDAEISVRRWWPREACGARGVRAEPGAVAVVRHVNERHERETVKRAAAAAAHRERARAHERPRPLPARVVFLVSVGACKE